MSFTTNISGGIPPLIFQWNFGDGTANSTQQNPVHQFNSTGLKTVILSITEYDNTLTILTVNITVNLAPPTAPMNLQAIAMDGQVSLSWQAPFNDGNSTIWNYNIYRGTASDHEVYLTTLANVTVYNDTGVTNGQKYYYRITAINAIGESANSTEIDVIPSSVTAPLNLTITPGNGYLLLTWHVPLNDGGFPITHYMVYRGTSSGTEVFIASVDSGTSYNDTGAQYGQIYYYKVIAVTSIAMSPFSVEISGSISSIPAGLTSGIQNLSLSYSLITVFGIIGTVLFIGIPLGRSYFRLRKKQLR